MRYARLPMGAINKMADKTEKESEEDEKPYGSAGQHVSGDAEFNSDLGKVR